MNALPETVLRKAEMTTPAYAIEPNDRWFYAEQDRLEMRDAQRENYEEGVITTLVEIGQSSARLARVERQARDEAMEACLDTIFSDADQQSRFEEALLQVWASHRAGEDSAEHRLAAVLEHGLAAFARKQAHEKYR
jgi:hypothetical protein